MTDERQAPDPAMIPTEEDDTEGQAFTWSVVADPQKGRQLRQSWTPDDPQDAKTSRSHRPDEPKPAR
jgi:hypothetical protein